jgi:hypothetical protein
MPTQLLLVPGFFELEMATGRKPSSLFFSKKETATNAALDVGPASPC